MTQLPSQMLRYCTQDAIRIISLPPTPPPFRNNDSNYFWCNPQSILVPPGSVAQYKEAWPRYESIIEGNSE